MESGWKAQSLTAGRLAKGILLALRESKLDVEHLDLFADQDYCSAPLAVIPACGNSVQGHFATPGHDSLKRYEIWPHFSAVRHLSSSFTHHRGNPLPRCGSLTGQVWALQALIEAMPNLESLTLHWYTLRRHTAEYVDTSIEQEWLNCSIFGLKLPSLRTLKLSGIHTRAAGLHTFLQNTSLTHLTLQELHLYSGAWKPLLEYISSADCTISFLQLDDLFAEDRLIYFKVPGEPKFRSRGDAIGPSEITRKGAEVKEKLEYAFGKGRLLGSPEANRWSKERMRRYGPPDRML
nr:hypothetical protein B0A51_03657 [Rachicladosporium sp. CCFEE 5018]